MENKVRIFRELGRLLKNEGRIISVVSSPEIYVHEWASFSTKDFPENRHAKSGDVIRIVQMDIDDKRPVEDIVWTDEHYRETYKRAGLELIRSTSRWLGKTNRTNGSTRQKSHPGRSMH
jgi:hypothetical protein